MPPSLCDFIVSRIKALPNLGVDTAVVVERFREWERDLHRALRPDQLGDRLYKEAMVYLYRGLESGSIPGNNLPPMPPLPGEIEQEIEKIRQDSALLSKIEELLGALRKVSPVFQQFCQSYMKQYGSSNPELRKIVTQMLDAIVSGSGTPSIADPLETKSLFYRRLVSLFQKFKTTCREFPLLKDFDAFISELRRLVSDAAQPSAAASSTAGAPTAGTTAPGVSASQLAPAAVASSTSAVFKCRLSDEESLALKDAVRSSGILKRHLPSSDAIAAAGMSAGGLTDELKRQLVGRSSFCSASAVLTIDFRLPPDLYQKVKWKPSPEGAAAADGKTRQMVQTPNGPADLAKLKMLSSSWESMDRLFSGDGGEDPLVLPTRVDSGVRQRSLEQFASESEQRSAILSLRATLCSKIHAQFVSDCHQVGDLFRPFTADGFLLKLLVHHPFQMHPECIYAGTSACDLDCSSFWIGVKQCPWMQVFDRMVHVLAQVAVESADACGCFPAIILYSEGETYPDTGISWRIMSDAVDETNAVFVKGRELFNARLVDALTVPVPSISSLAAPPSAAGTLRAYHVLWLYAQCMVDAQRYFTSLAEAFVPLL